MSEEDSFLYDTFPQKFLWGVATSAFQCEGGTKAGGRGVSIWDTFCLDHSNILDNSNADVTSDSYHKYQEDIKLIKELGVNFYRFSISWSRIIPDPTGSGEVNSAGVQYYNNLIDGLLAIEVMPLVTLYHFDLPQTIEDKGGFLNESVLVDCFKKYADVCFSEFGDRVKYWITFNEPKEITTLGYGNGCLAPGIKSPFDGVYQAAHNLIKAHASVWHLYDHSYRNTQNGKIFISLSSNFFMPKDANCPEDVEAVELAQQFSIGWFAHPIFVDGDYPPIMKNKIAEISKMEGREKSRLPEFTEEEKKFIKGTSDFLGFNYYTSKLVSVPDSDMPTDIEYDLDVLVKSTADPNWKSMSLFFLHVVPQGFRGILNWLKNEYNSVDVFITENGFSDSSGAVDDPERVQFFKSHINELLKAVKIDGCNVVAYTAWTLLDNFEWIFGYTCRFGLVSVDFDTEEKCRTPKKSFYFYSKVIKDNGFPAISE